MLTHFDAQILKNPDIIVVHPDDFKLTCGQQKETQLNIQNFQSQKLHPVKPINLCLRMTTFTANHLSATSQKPGTLLSLYSNASGDSVLVW